MPYNPDHTTVAHFPAPPNTADLEKWAAAQADALAGPPNLALLFFSGDCADSVPEITEIVRIYARVPDVAGCGAEAHIADDREIEDAGGVTIALLHLPDTRVLPRHLPSDCFHDPDRRDAIRNALGAEAADANAWLLLGSPESTGGEGWLPDWDRATGGATTAGGFPASDPREGAVRFTHNGEILEDGAFAIGLKGGVTLSTVVSQGCRPIGAAWPVTEAEDNVIRKIGNRPILEVLRDTLEDMSRQEQKQARGNIFVGLVLDEYKSSFDTGDFLVRNLAAIDPKSGAVAIATPPKIGQNLQFQIRDTRSAANDLERRLQEARTRLLERPVYGGCLFNCIGRGSALFGVPDHDVSAVRDALGPIPLSGVFCNGEFGPVGQRTRLHGYAASLALFVGAG